MTKGGLTVGRVQGTEVWVRHILLCNFHTITHCMEPKFHGTKFFADSLSVKVSQIVWERSYNCKISRFLGQAVKNFVPRKFGYTSCGRRCGEPFAPVSEPSVDPLLRDTLSVSLWTPDGRAIVHGQLCLVADSGEFHPLFTCGEMVL